MNSGAERARLRPYYAGACFGAWSAAIALAPGLSTKLVLAAPAAAIPVIWWTLRLPHRWITLFFASALLLPPLPIAIGDSGPHLCLLFAALGLIAGAVWIHEWRIDFTGPGAPLAALLAVLACSAGMAAFTSGLAPAAGS